MPAALVTRSWAELARPRQQVTKKPTRTIVQEQQKPKEAKENDIKIDPIAKRITDIIYSDDTVKYEGKIYLFRAYVIFLLRTWYSPWSYKSGK